MNSCFSIGVLFNNSSCREKSRDTEIVCSFSQNKMNLEAACSESLTKYYFRINLLINLFKVTVSCL